MAKRGVIMKDNKSQKKEEHEIKEEIPPEEFPEGSFRSSLHQEEDITNHALKDDERSMSPYAYPEKGIQRQFPGAYPTEDK